MSARSLNVVMLIGNLTRDPELRYTGNGTPVVTFGIATNKSWKNQEGNVEELAEFHNCVAWNKMAEICSQLLSKGMKVYVQGSLTTRSWQDDAGVTKYKTEIRVDDMILLDSKGKQGVGGVQTQDDDSSEGTNPKPKAKKSEDVEVDDDDQKDEADPLEDLPF